MTGAMFKEIVERICAANKISKTAVSRQLQISKVTLNRYEKDGVPPQKLPMVMYRLQPLMTIDLSHVTC